MCDLRPREDRGAPLQVRVGHRHRTSAPSAASRRSSPAAARRRGLMSSSRCFDRAAGATKSGGTTRRAAKMVCLDMDHPEIADFIEWKVREEKKAHALIAAGYPADFNGEAYHTISGQNSNNSRARDRRVHAGRARRRQVADALAHDRRGLRDATRPRTSGARSPRRRGPAPTRACSTTRRSTAGTPARTPARINASNPCSEYMFLDDTACNLASREPHQVPATRGRRSFDVEGYRHACRVFFIAQEILVDLSSYPTRADRQEQPRLPAARASATRTSAACSCRWASLRLPTRGARSPRRSRRSCAATPTRTSAEMAATKGAVRWLREEPRADAARHAHAPRRGLRDRPRRASRDGRSGDAPRAKTGTTPFASASSTATATRRRRSSRPPARSACSWTATRPASSPTSRS